MTWTIRPRSRTGQLYAITAGSGPKIILIHGVGLRAEAWGAQIDTLCRDYAVVAVDMPGHGQSAALGDGAGLAAFTDSIADTITEPAVVIGHSFGAMIALDMAIRHPAKLLAVAALNAIHARDDVAKAAVRARASSLDGVVSTKPDATLVRWFGTEKSPQREACHHWLSTVDPSGYRDAYRVFASEDGPASGDLRALRIPALFMTGANEPNSTPAMSRRMADLAPSGRCEVIKDAAHMLPMTHADQVTDILLQFIKEYAHAAD